MKRIGRALEFQICEVIRPLNRMREDPRTYFEARQIEKRSRGRPRITWTGQTARMGRKRGKLLNDGR